MDTLEQMLKELALPYPAIRVYCDLLENGSANARTIADRLNIARPSVYDHLLPLTTLGLVDELDSNGKTMFVIHDVDDIARMLEEKNERLQALQKNFATAKLSLQKKTTSIEPKIRFFEGKDGIAQILRDMLWEGERECCTVWPYHEMLTVLGKEQLESFNTKRIRHKISIRSIWTKKVKSSEQIWKGGDWNVARRYAPQHFSTDMGYSIYGDRVSFISSSNELYGFIVRSKDFAALMRAQFEILWKESREK